MYGRAFFIHSKTIILLYLSSNQRREKYKRPHLPLYEKYGLSIYLQMPILHLPKPHQE